MNENTADTPQTNFIRAQIDADLAAQTHQNIQTRFPPEPNGYLHIGHAKSICLNFGLALDYHGKCGLRFDDTNPAKEEAAYITSIEADIRWLGFTWDGEVCYSSAYFARFYDYAVELINKGLAYVCFLDADQTRAYRGTLKTAGKNSPYRDTPASENLDLLAKMRAGKFAQGECVLRAKIDMASSFMCLRDPTLYRIRFEKHHQTGNEWRIYPMYDFAHCISDAIEGVSHSLCTLEFQNNRHLYNWILDNLNDFARATNRPHQYEFSRLNLEYTVLSKRKLQQLVADNLVSGWDDPRMPTLSGLRRRGYTPASIRHFIEKVGISKVDGMTDIALLENSIREDLNLSAPRTMGVIDPIKLVIENYPQGQTETLNAPLHPQNPAMGAREITFSGALFIERDDFMEVAPNNKFKRLAVGKEVRLRNAYVVRATTFDTDFDGNITTVYATYDPDTLGKNPADGRKVKGVIHFVEATTARHAEFRIYDRLFTVENPGKHEHFKDLLNPNSLTITHGVVEKTMADAPIGIAYQFERVGYFARDDAGEDLVFNKTVGLRDIWNTPAKKQN